MKKFLISVLSVLLFTVSCAAIPASAKGVFSGQTTTIQCADGDMVVSGSFTNTDSVGSKYHVYCAVYDPDGRMSSVQVSEDLTVTSGTNDFSATFDIVSKEQNTKVYVLTKDMTPVCNNVEKTIKSFRVLAIGNSYSQDSLQYLDDVAKLGGFDNVVLGNMVIGGCDVATHWSNASSNNAAYRYEKNAAGTWVNTTGKTLLDGLLDEDWDYIALQQGSEASGIAGTYDSSITNLINFINENKTNKDALIGWHMTWAFGSDYYTYNTISAFRNIYNSDQMTMYNAIVDAVQKKILTNPGIAFVIPTGTAVQNARTSFIGDHLNRDGTNLDLYYGRYLAALTWYRAITGQSIDGFNYRLNNDFPASYLPVLKESVNNAIKNPFQITAFEKENDDTDKDADGVFSIAVIPDSQGEVNSSTAVNRRHSLNRTLWLADQQNELDLRCVVHTGDLVNWGNEDHSQLVIAAEAMEVLADAGIPTVMSLGNHDTAAVGVGGGAADPTQTRVRVRDTSAYNTYLPVSTYKGLVPYEDGKIDNSYLTFEACGTKWLVISLELWPRDEVIKWADGVIKDNPDYNVIISTHSYLNGNGTIGTSAEYGATSPQYLYDNLVKKYANIKFVLCGHVGNSAVRTDTGDNGNKIVSLLGCFHANTNPVKILNIDVENGSISGYVYSPIDEAHWEQYDFAVDGLEFIKSEPEDDPGDEPEVDPIDEEYSEDYNRLIPDARLGYYDSTVGSRLLYSANDSNKYVATQRFTKNDLPNGTLLVIDEGYAYRPEGWIDLTVKNSSSARPAEATTTVVEINDAWWGSFTYRAFNICSTAKTDLSDSVKKAASHFRIYVPKDAESGVVIDHTEGDADGVFSIGIIPDTQGEVNTQKAIENKHSLNRTQWLVNNREELDLRCVVHTGDANNWCDADPTQLDISCESMEILPAAGIPTVLSLGNHDTAAVGVGGSAADPTQTKVRVRNTDAYNSGFRIATYKGLVPFEDGKVDNSYLTFEACGTKWLVISLELWPRPEVIKWAESEIKARPNYNVIISTHSYMNGNGTIGTSAEYGTTSPQYLYDHLIKQCKNIKFVLCGHVGNSAVRTDTGVYGNKIVSLLGCFHANTNPVKILNIDVNNGSISGYVYSPIDDSHWQQYDFAVDGMEFIKSDSADDEAFYEEYIDTIRSRKPGEWEFKVPGDSEGFVAANATLEVSDDVMKGESVIKSDSSYDPLYTVSGLDLDVRKYNTVHVRMKANVQADTNLYMYFITKNDSSWTQSKSAFTTVKASNNGAFVEYEIKIGDNLLWDSTVTALRIDPIEKAGSFEIDYIRMAYDSSIRYYNGLPMAEELINGDAEGSENKFYSSNANISVVYDEDKESNVYLVEAKNQKSWLYFRQNVNWIAGAKYQVTADLKFTKTFSGRTDVGSQLLFNAVYEDAQGKTDHAVQLLDVSPKDGWKSVSFTVQIPANIVEGYGGQFAFYANPAEDTESINYMVDNVVVKRIS